MGRPPHPGRVPASPNYRQSASDSHRGQCTAQDPIVFGRRDCSTGACWTPPSIGALSRDESQGQREIHSLAADQRFRQESCFQRTSGTTKSQEWLGCRHVLRTRSDRFLQQALAITSRYPVGGISRPPMHASLTVVIRAAGTISLGLVPAGDSKRPAILSAVEIEQAE